MSPASATFRAFGFATFAAFWLVLKSFVGEKHLFAGGKNELRIAIRTLQYPVVVFHEPLPWSHAVQRKPARSVLVRPTTWGNDSGNAGSSQGLQAQAKQLPDSLAYGA